jgi:hypothetical protein
MNGHANGGGVMSDQLAWKLGDRCRIKSTGDEFIVTSLVERTYHGPTPRGLYADELEYVPPTLGDRVRWRAAQALGIDTLRQAAADLQEMLRSNSSASYASNRRCRDCSYAGRACDHRTG